MKTGFRPTLIVLFCFVLTALACNLGSPVPEPTASIPEPGTAAAPDAPTVTAAALAKSELSQTDLLAIVRASLSAYPWRLTQTVLPAGATQPSTSVTEAESSTRGYTRSVEVVGAETVTVESLLFDSQLYVKITGSPAATYGLPDGQWTELTPENPLSQLVDKGAIEPESLVETFSTDFASLSGDAGPDLVFQLVGPEEVNGVPANLYESKGTAFTYRWWIGADSRFYKTTLEIPEATRTLLTEYDPAIQVQKPIP